MFKNTVQYHIEEKNEYDKYAYNEDKSKANFSVINEINKDIIEEDLSVDLNNLFNPQIAHFKN